MLNHARTAGRASTVRAGPVRHGGTPGPQRQSTVRMSGDTEGYP